MNILAPHLRIASVHPGGLLRNVSNSNLEQGACHVNVYVAFLISSDIICLKCSSG